MGLEVLRFRQRMINRLGPIPEDGEELIRVVTLRRLGKYFGAERVVLKNHRMRLFFVSDAESPFYQSTAFGQLISFAATNAHRCRLEEQNGRRSLLVNEINSVKQAVELLRQMSETVVNDVK